MNQYIHKFTILSILFIIHLIDVTNSQQSQFYQLKAQINTEINLTKSLQVSPLDLQFAVGSKDGTIKIYNFNGTLQSQINQQSAQIFKIIWQKDKQGLVTISFDPVTNRTVAIVRKRYTFKQLRRWQFSQKVYNIDSTSSQTDCYIGFNFMNRVQQYQIRSGYKVATYPTYTNNKIMKMSYTSGYYYLYMIQNSKLLYLLRCGQVYGYFNSFVHELVDIWADKYDYQKSAIIYKYQNQEKTQFSVFDWGYYIPARFPIDIQMNYYRYCPKDYIIGVSYSQKVYIFSRDYNFTQYASIDRFQREKLTIMSISCQNGHLVVSCNNNYVYVYKLKPFKDEDDTNWVYIGVLIGLAVIIVGTISILIYQKIKKNKSLKQKATNNEVIQSLTSSVSQV